VVVYQFNRSNDMVGLLMAEEGRLEDGSLVLAQVSANSISPHALRSLADAQPTANKPVEVNQHATLTLNTTLTPELMLARVLTPERMSMVNLWRYIDYLNDNQLVNDRQVVAAWRKLIYPFTLLVMMAIAAPVSLMQSRRGGVGAKVFAGIIAGVTFFMANQLSLNAGMLYGWPLWVTAVVPNLLVFGIALSALLLLDHRNGLVLFWQRWWPWQRTATN